jgi:hypothetical protein
MRSRQTGITFIGWLFLLAPMAIVVFSVIKAMPIYFNYMKVAKAVEQVAEENGREDVVTPAQLRGDLQSRFDVESVDKPAVKDISVFREGENWVIEADYDDDAPLFAGIALRVHFNKSAVVR